MARPSKFKPRKPSKNRSKRTSNGAGARRRPPGGKGYDFGATGVILSVGNNALLDQFAKAEFWGCGYGYFPPTASTPALPMLALVGGNAEPLREGFAILRQWQDEAGPNAINVEIAYSDPGYVIVVSQDNRALQWRTVGFGNIGRPVSLNFSWGKRMDTRGAALEDMASYFNAPVAPVLFCAATAANRAPGGFDLVSDCDPILLAKVHLYRTEAEIPEYSSARRMINLTGEGASTSSDPNNGPREQTPEAISRERDQSILAMLPKTMLVLRHREDGLRLVASVMEQGFARWQAEQALANLRLADAASRWPKSEQRDALENLRQSYAEYAGEPYFPDKVEMRAVLRQIEADLGVLLADRIKVVPSGLSARMAKLRALGLD